MAWRIVGILVEEDIQVSPAGAHFFVYFVLTFAVRFNTKGVAPAEAFWWAVGAGLVGVLAYCVMPRLMKWVTMAVVLSPLWMFLVFLVTGKTKWP